MYFAYRDKRLRKSVRTGEIGVNFQRYTKYSFPYIYICFGVKDDNHSAVGDKITGNTLYARVGIKRITVPEKQKARKECYISAVN